MKNLASPSAANPAAKIVDQPKRPERPRKARRAGVKTLITLSSITATVGGWALLSTQALDAQASDNVAQEVTYAEPAFAPDARFEPLPTIAPVEKFEVAPLQPVNGTQAQTETAPVPTPRPMAVAPDPTAASQAQVEAQAQTQPVRPRRVRTRATTRSSG